MNEEENSATVIPGKKRGLRGMGCLVLTLILAALVSWGGIRSYNSFVDLNQNLERSWSRLENGLERQSAWLLRQTSEMEKYKDMHAEVLQTSQFLQQAFEDDLSQRLLQARKLYNSAQNLELAAELLWTADPDKKAEQLKMQDLLKAEKKEFNARADEYNRAIAHFPGRLIAKTTGWKEISYFKPETQGELTNP